MYIYMRLAKNVTHSRHYVTDVTSHRLWATNMVCSYRRKKCCSLKESRETTLGEDPPPRKTTPLPISGGSTADRRRFDGGGRGA